MMLDRMKAHLSLKTEGDRSSTAQTLNLLLKAVAEGSSLEAVCADSCGTVDSNTLREQLNGALAADELRQQEVEMNAALQAAIPPGMPRGGLEVAIDTHDEPFYGKTAELRAHTGKTRAQDGTTHFFRIASAYVIWREVRLTLALTYVLPQDTLPEVVDRLLTHTTYALAAARIEWYMTYLHRVRLGSVDQLTVGNGAAPQSGSPLLNR
jgi:hypothetical protein